MVSSSSSTSKMKMPSPPRSIELSFSSIWAAWLSVSLAAFSSLLVSRSRRRRSVAGVEREIPRSTCGANATRSTVVSREHDADILRSTRSARGAGAVVIDGVELVDRVDVEVHPHVRIVAVVKCMQRTGGQRDGARSACVVESVVSCVALCCGRG